MLSQSQVTFISGFALITTLLKKFFTMKDDLRIILNPCYGLQVLMLFMTAAVIIF